jgi:hypothetical protein
MRRLTLLGAALLVGAVAVGCSSSPSSTGASPSSSTSTSSPASTVTSPSISAVHWELNEAPSGAQLRITGYIGSSSCDSFDRVEVAESDSTVEIQVLVRSNGNEACTADMRLQAITVDLDEPLGGRELTGCAPFEIEPGVVDPEGCRRIVPRMS